MAIMNAQLAPQYIYIYIYSTKVAIHHTCQGDRGSHHAPLFHFAGGAPPGFMPTFVVDIEGSQAQAQPKVAQQIESGGLGGDLRTAISPATPGLALIVEIKVVKYTTTWLQRKLNNSQGITLTALIILK